MFYTILRDSARKKYEQGLLTSKGLKTEMRDLKKAALATKALDYRRAEVMSLIGSAGVAEEKILSDSEYALAAGLFDAIFER